MLAYLETFPGVYILFELRIRRSRHVPKVKTAGLTMRARDPDVSTVVTGGPVAEISAVKNSV